jgi:hypothetical protein
MMCFVCKSLLIVIDYFFQGRFSFGFRLDPQQGVHADPAAGQQQGQMGPGPRRSIETRGHQPGFFYPVSVKSLQTVC